MLPILLSEGNIRQILQFLIFSIVVSKQLVGNIQMRGEWVGFSVIQIVILNFSRFTKTIKIIFHSFYKLNFAFAVGILNENQIWFTRRTEKIAPFLDKMG